VLGIHGFISGPGNGWYERDDIVLLWFSLNKRFNQIHCNSFWCAVQYRLDGFNSSAM
jgi:hypothetical protein